MRYDGSHPDPGVEVRRRLGDLRERALRADQRPSRSHVQAVRIDQPAPSTSSLTPVGVYALTAIGDPGGSVMLLVDAAVATGAMGMVGVTLPDGTVLDSWPVGGMDVGRMTLGPVPIGDNDLSLAIWMASGSGSISARLIAAWVPDV